MRLRARHHELDDNQYCKGGQGLGKGDQGLMNEVPADFCDTYHHEES